MDEVWRHLAASGTLSLVLGYAVMTLWKQLELERKDFKKYRDVQEARVDKIRDECAKEKDELHKGQVSLVMELTQAVKDA